MLQIEFPWLNLLKENLIGVVTPSPGSQISPRMRKWGEKKGANAESLHMEDV